MGTDTHIPTRMCAQCRAKHSKADLVRFEKTADGLLETKSGHARGMYFCKPECHAQYLVRRTKSAKRKRV